MTTPPEFTNERPDVSTNEPSEICDTSLPFAEMYYKLGVAAYDSERSIQSHLWGRFRDTVSLMVVVATAHCAALFSLAKPGYSLFCFVLGATIVVTSGVFMFMSARALSRVYDGDNYSDQLPQETQRVTLQNGASLMEKTLIDTARALFECAKNNYVINSQRSRLLSDARRFLLIALFALIPVWLVVLGATIWESREARAKPTTALKVKPRPNLWVA